DCETPPVDSARGVRADPGAALEAIVYRRGSLRRMTDGNAHLLQPDHYIAQRVDPWHGGLLVTVDNQRAVLVTGNPKLERQFGAKARTQIRVDDVEVVRALFAGDQLDALGAEAYRFHVVADQADAVMAG